MDPSDFKADLLLRDIPNIKIGNGTLKDLKPPEVKAELQTLNLSDFSQDLIMNTLRFIHGPNFTLPEATSYEDKGSNFAKKYWTETGNLIVKGGTDYSSEIDTDKCLSDRFRAFALLRLQSYGFHDTHCEEALERAEGQVDIALHLLYEKYFNISENTGSCEFSENELLEQRNDEKNVLGSIYENNFEEKIAGSVWILKFPLKYIVEHFSTKNSKAPTVKQKKTLTNSKKLPKCKNYAKGHCKFGEKCRFSHEDAPVVKEENTFEQDHEFELEVRFPKTCIYPFKSPVILLKTNASLPQLACLHICKRLLQEADDHAVNGLCSIYSIAELLNNEDEIVNFLKNDKTYFPPAKEKLFPEANDSVDMFKILPKYFSKGLTNKDNKIIVTDEDRLKENRALVESFKRKKDDPNYIKMIVSRSHLPAWSKMGDILELIQSSQVSVISGETGCGKSTQVPQFIFEDWVLNFDKDSCRHIEIVCTQPRRISAIGVAERVASERLEKVGQTVGYSIRLESKISSATRLTFCTTGLLLRRLESDPNLSSVTHILVDEVHERSEESDFLLLIIKQLLSRRKDLKVILMSATLNATLFSNYFNGAPVLEIPGRTFPVEQLFLEDIFEITKFVVEENTEYTRKVKKGNDDYLGFDLESVEYKCCEKPKLALKDESLTLPQLAARYEGYSRQTCKNLYLMDTEKINLELIEAILLWIVNGSHDYPRDGSILIFLPGIAEITSLHELLNEHPEFSPRHGKYILLPLHSTLTNEEQSAIFKKPKRNERKIVLSTNLAETSITIDDCVFVIDSGKMKEKHFDSNRNMESLELVWVSRANALQRKGRAGRVKAGVCIHLFTKHRFNHHFLAQPIPEILRVPLEQLVLKIKILPNFYGRNIVEVLGDTLEPPTAESIESTITRLQDVGALNKSEQLTPLGHHLASLPVDVRIGKLMLFGAIFCCLDSALTIAACLSYKSPFVTPFDKKDQANAKKKSFAIANSDQLTVLRAYKKWQDTYAKSKLGGQVFARENYLSHKTLLMLADIKYQFLELLVSIGFVPIDLVGKRRTGEDNIWNLTGSKLNENGENTRMLSAILCAALYPNVVKILTPKKSFLMSAGGAIPKEIKAQDLKFKTKKDGYVNLHPSSVNYSVGHFQSPFLVFQEKVKTSRIFIRDCCMVPMIPLVLFSGCTINIELHQGNSMLSLEDGWIIFHVDKHEVAEMLKMIRAELLELLEEKIKDPCLNLLHSEKGAKIISTITYIVAND